MSALPRTPSQHFRSQRSRVEVVKETTRAAPRQLASSLPMTLGRRIAPCLRRQRHPTQWPSRRAKSSPDRYVCIPSFFSARQQQRNVAQDLPDRKRAQAVSTLEDSLQESTASTTSGERRLCFRFFQRIFPIHCDERLGDSPIAPTRKIRAPRRPQGATSWRASL